MDRRTQRMLLVVSFLGVACFIYGYGSRGALGMRWRAATASAKPLRFAGLQPANSTLGFGAVVAVSREQSSRREGLVLAANSTEIDLVIPQQPTWTEEDTNRLRAAAGSTITKGSALAWLGHLNALHWFVESGLETVLVMEDDVDWDIHLRTSQVPLAAAAVRQLIAAQSVSPGKTKYETELTSYWGNSSMWDILYLGHCGDRFNSSNWKFQIPNVMYEDMTLPPRVEMHPYTQSFLESISIPEYTRLIHQSVFPLCTFGYALTRNAAQRLITDVAVRGSDGGTTAYDVRILEACRDLGFRCWSANPELFHHLGIDSEIAIMNGAGGEDERTNEDGSGWMSYSRISHAPNIACGVRSHKSSTRNRHALDFLRGVDGRLQECLDSGRDDRMASSSVR